MIPPCFPCRAVLFDCDGVLVDSDESVVRAWSRWAVSYGLDPAEVVPLVHGRRAADTVALLIAPEVRDAALARINAYEIEDAAHVVPVPGARELVAGLGGAPWAVVTSGTRALATARLRAAGIAQPAVFVTADDVAAGKPAPDGYAGAAAALGVPAREPVVLEDADAGVRAARAAGVGAVIGVGLRAVSTGADVVVPDLAALTWDDGALHVRAGSALHVRAGGALHVPSASRPGA